MTTQALENQAAERRNMALADLGDRVAAGDLSAAEAEALVDSADEQVLGVVLASHTAELEDDIQLLGENVRIDAVEQVERSRLIAFADRLLRRLAGDEARVSELNRALKHEVELISNRYKAMIAQIHKGATWKQWSLEKLAAVLLPDPKAKPKSLNLAYGTLARKDVSDTYELVDESAALALAKIQARKNVKITIESDLETLEQHLIALVRKIEGRGIINGAIREFLDDCVDNKMGTTTATLDFKWGAAKKEPAIALYAVKSEQFPNGHGVELVPAHAEFSVKITEG